MSAAVQEAINLINALPEADVIDLVEIMKKRREEAEKMKLEKKRAAFEEINGILDKYPETISEDNDSKEEYYQYLESKYAALN